MATLGRKSILTALVVVSACVVDSGDVTLSYQLRQDWCEDCEGFELKLGSGGHVWFTGLAGCAVPGSHHYRIPSTDFDDLVRAFHDARFFGIPRTGQKEIDAGILVLTYRDRARIHEVEDWGRDDPKLRSLERRVHAIARPVRYLTPSAELYEELLRNRWDVNAKNEDGWTALRCAVSRNRVDAVRTLLANGARVADEDLLWAFGMDGAIRAGAILQLLVSAAGVDPRDRITSDLLVLAAAAARDSTALRFLLQHGVNVDAVGRSGQSALTAAVDAASRPNVLLLLSHGAEPNLRTGKDGATALHHAAVGNETGLVTLLKDHGAEIDSRDAMGLTPLMHAARRCTYWNIGALLEAGADVRAADTDGRTAREMVMPKISAETRREFSDNRRNCEMTRALLSGNF